MDAPGEACRLLEEGGSRAGAPGTGQQGAGKAAGASARTLRAQDTRTPPNERRAEGRVGSEASGPDRLDGEHHDGNTDHGDDMATSDPELVEEPGDDGETATDVNAMVRAMIAETNLKIDQIKAQQDAAIVAIGDKLQGQLRGQKKQIEQLTSKVEESQRQTERLRLQMVEAGHKADTRFATTDKKMEQMMEMIKESRTGAAGGASSAAGSTSRSRTGPTASGGDPTVIRANTQIAVDKAAVVKALRGFATAYTQVESDTIWATGPDVGRQFVIKFQGGAEAATHNVEEIIAALRDPSGQWRALDAQVSGGGLTRVYVGRDKPVEQLQREIFGKRLVKALQQRLPKADVFFVRRDAVVKVDRVPTAKVLPSAGGEPELQWNYSSLEAIGVSKDELLLDLARLGGPGGGPVAWSS